MIRRKKGLVVKSFSFLITIFIIGLLVLSGPALAFNINLDIDETIIEVGETISFMGSVEINNNENLPVDNLILNLNGAEDVSCLFMPNGSIISGCKGLTITYIGNASFEYGNGYGYYGYGYDFGYGYGFTNGLLMYNFTLNTTEYLPGNYSTKITANIDSKEFSNNGENIIIGEGVDINEVLVSKECNYEGEEIIVSANITGSVNLVFVETNIDGVYSNHTTDFSFGYYFTTLNASGGQNLSWRFGALDIFGNIIYSSWDSQYINRRTKLTINPINPDGLNDWYVTEPIFTLTNPDSNIIWYRWNGDPRIEYTGSFGLEDISNLDKQSAGTLKLIYFANTSCGMEEWTKEILYVDLTDPLITNLVPENNTIINNQKPTISAYLDEVYQSNSGIDESSIIMKIDGSVISPIITPDDELDRILIYHPLTDLSLGEHEAYIYTKDNSGRDSQISWKFTINATSLLDLNIHSPENIDYDSKRVKFNITTSEEVKEIKYINYNDNRPRLRTLCRDCEEYGNLRKKTRNLVEGENNITIIAIDKFGYTTEENITLFIDSVKPRVSRTEPRRNKIVNGSLFYLKLKEDNLKEIFININFNNSVTMIPLDINNCVQDRSYKECDWELNLDGYDGEEIEYWYNLSDGINNVGSRKTKIKVDTTNPTLNVYSPQGMIYDSRRIQFNITISEEVLLEYYDYNSNNPRWRRLTSNKDEYGNLRKKTRSFKRGNQTIDIRAKDKAGNVDIKQVKFSVDY